MPEPNTPLANLLKGYVSSNRAALEPPPLVLPEERNPFDVPPIPDPLDVKFSDALTEGATSQASDFVEDPETASKLGSVFANLVQLPTGVALAAPFMDAATSDKPETIWTATSNAMSALNPLSKINKVADALTPEVKPIEPVPTPAADVLTPAVEPPLAAPKTYKSSLSNVKHKTPLEDMEMTYKPFGDMRAKRLLNPESLLGSTIIPVRGDPAIAGQTLTSIGGEKIDPVDLHGGEGFPRMESSIKQGTGWASQPGAAAALSNRAKRIYEETGGKPVVGGYMKMSDTSTHFNTMLADTLHQMFKLKRSDISQADIEEFDRLMREQPMNVNKKTGKADFPAYADWPGIENLTPEYIRKGSGPKGDGKVRTKMAKLMDTKYWQDKGFPEVGYANAAISDKALRDVPSHTTVGAAIEFDPEGRTIDNPDVAHPTYARQNVAKELGVLPELPLDVLYPGVRESTQPQYLAKILETKPPSILVDQQTLDRVMKYLRSQDGAKWGLGGAVTAGILSQEQADDIEKEL